MRRAPALLGGLLGLLLLLHLAIALRGSQVDWGPDFTVADLRSRPCGLGGPDRGGARHR